MIQHWFSFWKCILVVPLLHLSQHKIMQIWGRHLWWLSQAARQLTNISNLILKSQIWLPQRYMTLEQSILDAKFNVHEPHDFFLLAFFSWCQSTMQIWVKSCRLCRRRWKFLRTLKYHISNEFKFTQACSGRGEKMVFLALKGTFYCKKVLATWTIYTLGNFQGVGVSLQYSIFSPTGKKPILMSHCF